MVVANSYLIQNRETAWNVAPASSFPVKWYYYTYTEDQLHAASLAFLNADYVDIATNFYRNRLLYARGDPNYEDLANELDRQAVITVPSVTLDPDEAVVFPATDGSSTAKFFFGPRVHHIVKGCGENIPLQEPQVFAEAIFEVSQLGS
ncbi:epoxide hydrolase [Penicillium angulare]|uniref:Epoxide hydrolase n=1 Tax=Penicillium angulare TaxID=116970 RepID=A0A9W9KK46_9EURO|nr:epoxide hydrolase [Penicillium angulare]